MSRPAPRAPGPRPRPGRPLPRRAGAPGGGARRAPPPPPARTEAEVIVFCGVHFMAETASILCPGKTVLLPDLEAGCSLAATITADELRERNGARSTAGGGAEGDTTG